jgi:hypothetical protein
MSKNKYTIRFNLGAGENFMKWRIVSPGGDVQYLDPNDVTLFLEGCKLVNQKSAANKIYEGANKVVCAWIEAKNVTIFNRSTADLMVCVDKVSYNPRVTPNWVIKGKNVDKQEVGDLITNGSSVFTF